MGKNNGTTLVVLALIFGIAGCGLGGAIYIGVLPPQSTGNDERITALEEEVAALQDAITNGGVNTINRVYYINRSASHSLSSSYNAVPLMEIDIIVEEGEKVFFNLDAEFACTSGAYATGGIRLDIDGTEVEISQKGFFADETGFQHYDCLSSSYVANDLTTGTHTIIVEATGGPIGSVIQNINLYIHTFS